MRRPYDYYQALEFTRGGRELLPRGRTGNYGVAETETSSRFTSATGRPPIEGLLPDRGVMREGCINIRQIRGWLEEAGFTGFVEVEIFSTRCWEMDQKSYLQRILEAYRNCL